ncbi:Serine/threonine-protein kinase PknB [Planctomycetes bacterium MalM25]|nr:Serine/threonine-protein kinase PknB [Planctomycetes bacterium MalM25]
MDDLTGQRLNDYQLLRQLGRGAMASVYLAEQQSLARRVALKVLAAELCRDQAYVDRFQHEARAAASLVHPGIVQVYEVGKVEIDGVERHYLAQEYVADGTLGRHAQRNGALEPGRVLEVLWQVGAALAAAAERGLVHRDIKPDNLMVDRSGAIKVADFGLARLAEANTPRMTQAGVAMGTPLYMSPEQIEGRDIDARSDLYSLGVTAYQLLTGDPPFTGDTPLSVAVQHLNSEPDPVAERRPETPPELAEVIDRLIAKSPGDRYASPTAMLEELSYVARVAERDGWATAATLSGAGLVGASTLAGGWAPRTGDDAEAVDRLSEAMRKESRNPSTAGFPLVRALRWALPGLLLGGLLATAMTPRPLIRPGAIRIERFDSVKQQLFHAKTTDTPDAWRAVLDYHPDEDDFYQRLALRGLALCHLRRGDNGQAVRTLERLPDTTVGDEGLSDPAIAVARVVAYSRTGQPDKARTAGAALSSVSPGERARLQGLLPELFEEASSAL